MIAVCLGVSCHTAPQEPKRLHAATKATEPAPFGFRRDEPSENARIILVATSSRGANFAQEIIDQRELWLGRGVPEAQITCYYVAPLKEEIEEDREQFLALASALRECYPADLSLLRTQLEKIAQESRGRGDYLYIYLTGHGREPVPYQLEGMDRSDKRYQLYRRLLPYPAFHEYRLDVETVHGQTAGLSQILEALQAGVTEEELLITPRLLKRALMSSVPDLEKYLVIQGCFSGGFLDDPREEYRQHLLRDLPKLTVLTAARYDRSSFGCDEGERTSYFGGIFNEVLAQHAGLPPSIPWRIVYEEVSRRVLKLEQTKGEPERSLPQFYSSQR